MKQPLTELEKSIVAKLAEASFPPATASKRFARDLASGYVKELSDKGRKFLAYVTHRFRKQYTLTAKEQAWVNEWINWQPVAEPEKPKAEKPPIEAIESSGDLFA